MNERIKEIMAKCNYVVDGTCHTNREEKFAELIIRECAKINNQFIGRRIGEIDLDMVYKEHFGVEV